MSYKNVRVPLCINIIISLVNEQNTKHEEKWEKMKFSSFQPKITFISFHLVMSSYRHRTYEKRNSAVDLCATLSLSFIVMSTKGKNERGGGIWKTERKFRLELIHKKDFLVVRSSFTAFNVRYFHCGWYFVSLKLSFMLNSDTYLLKIFITQDDEEIRDDIRRFEGDFDEI